MFDWSIVQNWHAAMRRVFADIPAWWGVYHADLMQIICGFLLFLCGLYLCRLSLQWVTFAQKRVYSYPMRAPIKPILEYGLIGLKPHAPWLCALCLHAISQQYVVFARAQAVFEWLLWLYIVYLSLIHI